MAEAQLPAKVVFINFATHDELKSVYGVGDKIAGAILDLRRRMGDIDRDSFVKYIPMHMSVPLLACFDFTPRPSCSSDEEDDSYLPSRGFKWFWGNLSKRGRSMPTMSRPQPGLLKPEDLAPLPQPRARSTPYPYYRMTGAPPFMSPILGNTGHVDAPRSAPVASQYASIQSGRSDQPHYATVLSQSVQLSTPVVPFALQGAQPPPPGAVGPIAQSAPIPSLSMPIMYSLSGSALTAAQPNSMQSVLSQGPGVSTFSMQSMQPPTTQPIAPGSMVSSTSTSSAVGPSQFRPTDFIRLIPRGLTFSGSGNWLAFKRKFMKFGEMSGWSEDQLGYALSWCLEGKAVDFYATITENDEHMQYSEIIRRLEVRFGEQDNEQTAQVVFLKARQLKGEKLKDWSDRVQSLGTKAFKGLPEAHGVNQMVVRFCQGLLDRAAGRHVGLQSPESLEQAVKMVRKYQQFADPMYPEQASEHYTQGEDDQAYTYEVAGGQRPDVGCEEQAYDPEVERLSRALQDLSQKYEFLSDQFDSLQSRNSPGRSVRSRSNPHY